MRRKLPNERKSITHKFRIAKGSPESAKGYITIGLYDDGTPGELFINIAKEGSSISGTMNCFATMVSIALQHGVPIEDLVKKFSNVAFEPSGMTDNEEIPMAVSVIDYIFKWIGKKFVKENE